MPDITIDWIVLLTALLVIITGYYAWVTHRIANFNKGVLLNMEKQYEAINRPQIVSSVAIRRGEPVFVLKIQNVGKTAANDVRMSLDADVYLWGEPHHNMRNLDAFSRPIASIGPAQVIQFDLGTSAQVLGGSAGSPLKFNIEVEYSGEARTYRETMHIDISPYVGSSFGDPLIQAAKAIPQDLKNIAREVHGIAAKMK